MLILNWLLYLKPDMQYFYLLKKYFLDIVCLLSYLFIPTAIMLSKNLLYSAIKAYFSLLYITFN